MGPIGNQAITSDRAECPLCDGLGHLLAGTQFYECERCQGRFRDVRFLPGPVEEKARYETHENDVNDPGYQQFVLPIVSAVLEEFTPAHAGLDFGSGTGPVISKLLMDRNYDIVQYDPYFCNIPELLEITYNYIVCCEVIEHFHVPSREFALLSKMLSPGGRLYCMTHIYSPEIDFKNWYYIRDFTHVFIYQPATLQWVGRRFGLGTNVVSDRLVVFDGSQ